MWNNAKVKMWSIAVTYTRKDIERKGERGKVINFILCDVLFFFCKLLINKTKTTLTSTYKIETEKKQFIAIGNERQRPTAKKNLKKKTTTKEELN